jgi:hypothetical protein
MQELRVGGRIFSNIVLKRSVENVCVCGVVGGGG